MSAATRSNETSRPVSARSRRRIAGLFCILGLGPLLLVAYLTTTMSTSALRDELIDRVSSVARHSALYVDQVFGARSSLMSNTAKRPAIVAAAAPAGDVTAGAPDPTTAAKAELDALQKSSPAMLSAALVDPSGKIITSVGAPLPGPATGVSTGWQASVTKDQLYISDSHQVQGDPSIGDRTVVTIAFPVHAAPDASGATPAPAAVIEAVFDLRTLQDSITAFSVEQKVSVTVADRRGNLIVNAGANAAANGDVPLRDALAGKTGTSEGTIAGTPMLLASAGTANSGWVAIVRIPTDTAFVGIQDLIRAVLLITGALGLLFLVGIRILNAAMRRQQAAEQALRATARELEHRATHDAMTGLANRVLFRDRLEQALRIFERHPERQVSVLLLDMNGFKAVNDTLGHHAGDLLIKEVGRRLASTVRASDTVARLGGDEFAVVAPETDLEGGTRLMQKLNAALAGVYELDGDTVHSQAAIGLAVCPRDADDPETLLRLADAAMYETKLRMKRQAATATA